MSTWKITELDKIPTLNNPVLIEGLPGIGNVGKVAVDFLVDELKAKKIIRFDSFAYPHTVFVNEENLVELPTIEVYYKKTKGKNDLLFLTGDVQPIDEKSCYEFSDAALEVFEKMKGSEIVTLGGIALKNVPQKPLVFCTGTTKKIVDKYKKGTKINNELYGVVGPIIGVSGVMMGLAGRRKINAISLLAETYGHPMYLGVRGAHELIKVLNKKLSLKLNMKKLEKEIDELENELDEHSKEATNLKHKAALTKLKRTQETRYIG